MLSGRAFFSFVIQKEMWSTSDAPLEDLCDDVTWLEVPYDEKDAAKSHRARWDPEKKQWYVPPNVDRTPLRQWMKARVHLNCDIEDRNVVKERGARWDPVARKWYILEDMDRDMFADWL